MIRFKQTSKEYGDCTADYEVMLDKQYTVREFVSFVLSQKDEWGTIQIYDPDKSWLDYDKYEYRYGNLNDDIPNEIMGKKIISVSAHGGWTAMDYVLKLEQ